MASAWWFIGTRPRTVSCSARMGVPSNARCWLSDRRLFAPGLFGPGAFLWLFPAGHYVLGPVNLLLWGITWRRLSSTLPEFGPFGCLAGFMSYNNYGSVLGVLLGRDLCRTMLPAFSRLGFLRYF